MQPVLVRSPPTRVLHAVERWILTFPSSKRQGCGDDVSGVQNVNRLWGPHRIDSPERIAPEVGL